VQQLITEQLFEFEAELATAWDIEGTPHGARRIVTTNGGSFVGPKIKGELLHGADWLVVRPDGVREIDARVTLRTDDNHIIYMFYKGLITGVPDQDADPTTYYFRTTPIFETGSDRYGWLNRIVSVGVGRRAGTRERPRVEYSIFQIL
jgi:hypothetical protein